MKVITIMNYKGGVGKTATAVNLSYNLSERGYKTLLIDCDPQGNASYFYGKYDEKKKKLNRSPPGNVYLGNFDQKNKIQESGYCAG